MVRLFHDAQRERETESECEKKTETQSATGEREIFYQLPTSRPIARINV